MQRRYEVPPDQGHVGDLRDDADGDGLRLHDLEALLQNGFALPAGGVVVKKDVKRVKLPVLRVDAVGGKAAAQTVGTVMHGDHAVDNGFAGHPFSLAGDDGGNGAS